MNLCPLVKLRLRPSLGNGPVPFPRRIAGQGARTCITLRAHRYTRHTALAKPAGHRQGVQCRADPAGGESEPAPKHVENVQMIITALAKVSNAWTKYDKDRSGTMSLKECEAIFNSPELGEAFTLLTNIPARHLTSDALEPFFRRADRDHSGTLSRSEFLALYLAVVSDRVKRNPLLLAEALLGFLDRDRNGVLEGGELKVLLGILGFPAALLMPIPSFMRLEYRAILEQLGR